MNLGKTIFIPVLFLFQACLGQDKTTPHAVSPLDFFKEEITLTVNDSAASIKGVYFFRNNTQRNGNTPIMFPFYIDSKSLFPEIICPYIMSGKDTTFLSYHNTKNLKAVMIEIPMIPNGITIWHLDYYQKILGTQATYILTSTAGWGKPLEDATYRFIVPSSYDSVYAWPKPDSTIDRETHRELVAHRTSFMPGQDMILRWKSYP